MEMEKKNLAIIVLAIALAASGVGNIILGVMTGAIRLVGGEKNTLVVGWGSNPAALDPVDTWDVPSHVMQHQTTESLVEYNLSTHPDYEIKMVLATDYVWESDTRISFTLRKGVQFQDGTAMTAEAVKWNFERVQYFCNTTGTLEANTTSWVGFPSSLFFFTDGTPIFASFEADDAVDRYKFTIVLSKPFGALLDLLCFGATNILSPASTPRYTYLDLADGDLVGTGAYDYIHFKRDWEVRYERFNNYWGPKPYFDEVVCSIIEEDPARMVAGLAGQYDYVGGVTKTYIDTFKADTDFHVEDVGEDLCYFYLEIYCGPMSSNGTMLQPGNPQYQKNPAYLRRALALAINYTYIYEEIQAGYAVEGTTAVPRQMPGHNASVVQASSSSFTWEDNVIKARQFLKDNAADIVTRGGMDISGFDINTDGDWTGKNILGRDLGINRHFGSTSNQRVNQLMANNFDLIGIQTVEEIREWGVYLDTGENTPWVMDIGYVGWCPDYLNPFNMIDPLFNLASGSCFSRINDTSTGGLTELMDAAAAETDLSLQLDYYMKIQSLIYDINRPLNPASHAHISGWVYLVQQTHKTSLKGVQYNVMTQQEFCHWYNE
jgi:peptide/nickel transport system substrate-binding protein